MTPLSLRLTLRPAAIFHLLLFCVLLGQLPATTVQPPPFEQLVNGSDYIVRAKVTGIRYEATERNGRPWVHTYVQLEVRETIAGQPPATVELRLLGGKAPNGDEMRVEGVPEFKVGDEDVLFVHGNGRNFYPLYAVMHGRYPIRKDAAGREYIARSNDVPMADVAEVALPLAQGGAARVQKNVKRTSDALTPAAFIQQIKQTRQEATGDVQK